MLYLCAAAAAGAVAWGLRRKAGLLPAMMMLVLPFCVGGFHGYTAATAALALLAGLFFRCRQRGHLRLRLDGMTLALGLTVVILALSPLWAADRGMSIFGILPWLGAAAYWLYLEQGENRHEALDLVPFCGVAMTAVSIALLLIPQTRPLLTVNGRLAGFFQYPNTFAAFLLAGFLLLSAREKWPTGTFPMLCLLSWGILLSGSRTAFLLLAASSFLTMAVKRDRLSVSRIPMALLAGMVLGQLSESLGLLSQANRYLELDQGGTFYARLLYWQDALPLLGKHPLGLGYLGWRSLQGTVQTGRYTVTFVHNGPLQLALDAGWLSALAMVLALLRGIFARELSWDRRLLLGVLCAYCLVDFHTEYLIIWVLLLTAMPAPGGKALCLRAKPVLAAAGAVLGAVCLWLGASQALYHSGSIDACLALTPFHTDALEAKVSQTEDLALAEKLLELDPHRSRGWNTLAWDALEREDWTAMREYKDQAIRCQRYEIGQYIDYVNCFHTALVTCLDTGREEEAWLLAEDLLRVETLLARTEAATSPLALATGDDNTLTLPDNYEEMLDRLEDILAE